MLIIQNLERDRDPFFSLIIQAKDLTANKLLEYLEKMDRYDVVDDTIALMGKFEILFEVSMLLCGFNNNMCLFRRRPVSSLKAKHFK